MPKSRRISTLVVNPLPGQSNRISLELAIKLCNSGMASWVTDHSIQYHPRKQLPVGRSTSDIYVKERGVIYWNGARSHYVGGMDVAMFPPCCNVVFPKIGTVAAARRYTG